MQFPIKFKILLRNFITSFNQKNEFLSHFYFCHNTAIFIFLYQLKRNHVQIDIINMSNIDPITRGDQAEFSVTVSRSLEHAGETTLKATSLYSHV